jgi:hypothetical protein
LLVAPVNFKEALELCNEGLGLVKSIVHNGGDSVLLLLTDRLVNNPGLGIEVHGLGLIPDVTSHLIPFFEGVSIVLKILVLSPSLEVGDVLETNCEGVEDSVDELLLVGNKSDPELVDIGYSLLV